MALVVKDRVLETSNTNGTGTFTLAGAVNGFQEFSVIGVGNTTYYAITEETNNQWEVGIGTVGSGILTRDTVLSSSNSGNKVDFADGLKQVFCDYPASKSLFLDNNGNLTTNNLFEGFSNTAASGTQIVLTAASVPSYVITGSGGQTIKLPDATTLPNGTTFSFNNNQSSGAISVNNNSNTLVVSIPSGAFTIVTLLSNSIAAGSWDTHDQSPANVSWSTNTFSYAGSFTNGTWNGNTVAYNRGGTGQSSALVAGAVVYGSSTTAMGVTAAGTSGQVLTSAGAGTPTWTTPTTGTVTSVGGTGTVNGLALSGTVTSSGNLTLGGTLDLSSPPAIGGTTPAAGTFTTITGQTEVLKGTGQNLLTYSQNLLGADWAINNTTVSATLYTDPLGGTTANDLIESAATSRHYISASITTVISGINYTFSSYCKTGVGASAANIVQLTFATAQFSASSYANFNLNTGAIGASAGLVSSSITSIGNGWYRCSITATATATGTLSNTYIGLTNNNNALGRLPSYAGSTSADVLVWGVQLEIGSTLNTYIPTTTTAIYGTPTLSFSGVAGLGLQSDGSLYASSAGTGNIRFYTNNVALEQMRVSSTASAVDYVQVTGATTASKVVAISAQGSDTDVTLSLAPKGAGTIRFGTYTAGVLTPAGYITITDSGGTSRRLLVG